MLLKIHKSCRNVVALADKELLGKKFEEGKLQLDMTTTFFKGELVDEKKAIKILQDQLREDATFNIVGEKAIATAKKADIITEKNISKIQNIPFALKLL